jgi:hypothetical protein
VTDFVGNERKFPLKDLTGKQEEDSKRLREHFERLKAIVPRLEPRDGGNEIIAITTTTTASQTISPASVPENAVGCHFVVATDRTSSGTFRWRMDSNDSWRFIGQLTGATQTQIYGHGFFTPGGSTFDVSWGSTVSGGTGANLYVLTWIY